ncbi:MAG TPA: MFS transporter [Alphaproteobacteria bacterium]|nr:MFS transporter [Alphaproteobacteria bacterium]
MSSLSLRLALAFAASTAVFGIAMPFWPIWYAQQGLGPAEIGWIAAAGTLARVVASPLIGALADRFGRPKLWLIGLLAVGAMATALYSVAQGFWAVLFVATLFSACLVPVGPLVDGIALAQPQLNYGRLRLWASASFAAAVLFSGVVAQAYSVDALLWVAVALVLLGIPAMAMLPATARPVARSFGGGFALLRDRRVLTLFLAAGLIQNSHAVMNGYASLHWQSLGISAQGISAIWTAGVTAEIALFFAAAWFTRFIGPARWMLIGGGVAILRWGLAAVATAPLALGALQTLHAFSFAATHLGTLALLQRFVPAERYGTAMGLYSALPLGLGAIVANGLSGLLFDRLGGQAFLAMAVLAGIGTLFVLPLLTAGRTAPAPTAVA